MVGWKEQVREWGSDPTPENARNLIRAYRNCDSGEVRLEIVDGLGRFSDARSHRFLVDVVRFETDLAERVIAVRSIGRRGGVFSRRILRRFLDELPPALEGAVITALGQSRAFGAVPRLISRFDQAVRERDVPVVKALVVSLGELKGTEAIAGIRSLLVQDWIRAERELSLAILFALGRLERNPDSFVALEPEFSDDPFSFQVFESALNQIQLRSQVRIEDYLHRVFHSPDPHPGLPLELRAFDPEELTAGLSVFDRAVHWQRHLFCLRALDARAQNSLFEGWVIPESDRDGFLLALAEIDEWTDPCGAMAHLDRAMPGWCDSPDRRLSRIAAVPPAVDWIEEAGRFANEDDSRKITLLNHWSDWNPVLSEPERTRIHLEWIPFLRTPAVKARWFRSGADAGLPADPFESELLEGFGDPLIRDSALLFAARSGSPLLIGALRGLTSGDRAQCLPGILRYLESLAGRAGVKNDSEATEALTAILPEALASSAAGTRVGLLRVLQKMPVPGYESLIASWATDPDPQVALNAWAALRNFPDSAEVLALLDAGFESPSVEILDRALDVACGSRVAVVRQKLLEVLAARSYEERVVERVRRGLFPGCGDDRLTSRVLQEVLGSDRTHPHSAKLEEVLGRFIPPIPEDVQSNPELERIDSRLREEIPRFDELDGAIRLALRAAEQPFLQAGLLERLPIDKAPTVLQYCKALDLVLDRYLGRNLLFPVLDGSLHAFQAVWHRLGFVEAHPPVERVIYLTGLKGRIEAEQFPLHKAKMMCGTFFNGRIMQDRHKVFDGLRAWAVIFLLFTRRLPGKDGGVGPLVPLKQAGEADCLDVALKLMELQDLRNPAAHRQTYPDLDSVREVRQDSLLLVNRILDWVL